MIENLWFMDLVEGIVLKANLENKSKCDFETW